MLFTVFEPSLLTAVEFIRAVSAVLQPIAALRVVVTGPVSTRLLCTLRIVCKQKEKKHKHIRFAIMLLKWFQLNTVRMHQRSVFWTVKYNMLSFSVDVNVLLQLFSSELSTQSFTRSHLYLLGMHWPSWHVNWSELQVRSPEWIRGCEWAN